MPYPEICRLTAAGMLEQLTQSHSAVHACLAEMEELTSQTVPDRLKYTTARFRISRASMQRRTCFNQICGQISENATSSEGAVVARLQELDRALLRASAEHVSKWTADSIQDNWLAYCEASKQIRQKMVLELEAEQEFLFPLLRRRSIEPEGCSRAA